MTEKSGEGQTVRKKTSDGSHTLYSVRFNQTYHSPGGAVTESRHVFFKKSGLLDRLKTDQPLTIFETGYGTGLNFLLLLDYYHQFNCSSIVHYHSVEADPISEGQVRKLNYSEHINHSPLFNRLTGLYGKIEHGVNRFFPLPKVELILFKGKFSDYEPGQIEADFIFHDPFSPEVNPELWTKDVFEKIKAFSDPSVVLATYCAASKARGAMAAAGWKVAREEGAPGKREMTLASPDADRLEGLDRVNESRLALRYRNDDFD